MDWPPVWVLFPTYRRTATAVNTLKSLGTHLRYPNYHVHICDNGSGETDDGTGRWHVGVLADAIAEFDPGVTWHEMPRQQGHSFNVGSNVNRAMRLTRENGAQIVLMNFDDFALVDDLDLRPMVDLLDRYPDVGLVRLGYWVKGLAGVCCEYDLPRMGKPYMWIRLMRGWSTDSYLFSMQPHVAHLRFFDAYSYYTERGSPGETETHMSGVFHRKHNGPDILFPLGRKYVHTPYRHTAPRQRDYADAAGDPVFEDLNP